MHRGPPFTQRNVGHYLKQRQLFGVLETRLVMFDVVQRVCWPIALLFTYQAERMEVHTDMTTDVCNL